jgi:hypothetical protein
MEQLVSVCKYNDDIELVLKKIEKVAEDFVFNLEIKKFEDVLKINGIQTKDYEQYYQQLNEFLASSHFSLSKDHTVYRARNAHRILSLRHRFSSERQSKILEGCFLTLI